MTREWITKGVEPMLLEQMKNGLPASELWSLLLEVIERRTAARSLSSVTQQWRSDRFVVPSYVDQRTALEIDRQLFAAADAFEAIELSPLAPLGACSLVAPTSQNRVVSTVRGTEVVSDPTNILALESTHRLRVDQHATIKLVTSHRCVRAQAVPKLPGFSAHFRMFCLSSAGHETKDHAFTVDALAEHVKTHLRSLDLLEQVGFSFPGRVVTFLSTPERKPLADRVAAQIHDIEVKHAGLDKQYYDGLRFIINVAGTNGKIPLIDGGAFDWVAKLASNRKLVFAASAIGSQLVAYLFRR